MPSLAQVVKLNATLAPKSTPVALFVGGTSGIGQGTVEAFARHTHGNAHILICGRNKEAAEKIFAKFPKPTSPDAKREFVQCDVTLMKNVHSVTQDLVSRLPKLNYLVITTGIFSLNGLDETPEGIDRKLAVHYYSRWKITNELLPLLRKARDAGEDAKALSVLDPITGAKIDWDDLGLKKNFTLANAANYARVANDLMVQSFAEQPDNQGIVFTHSGPGAVRTSILKNSNLHPLLRAANPLLAALVYPFSNSQEDCGEFMLRSLLAGTPAERGWYRRNAKAEEVTSEGYATDKEFRDKLWKHTAEVTNVPA
ncbi:NAD(P)-binding protein [Punctularia strigosozonata HHB-11173 SS5]|uniref:NAD(P)-binding protein n=1 Tax=Punctularia strigosozonata (strain HHB-11173) TaxID=741275 RepID=UPI0004417FA4|nr:NAD(P)-binding protein [Punctularia strigosozonata HHB-11173 SS5]EIN08969.1 NAD(P)-binding protein [Punctularia strigosozonata HHB-11173 SS5]